MTMNLYYNRSILFMAGNWVRFYLTGLLISSANLESISLLTNLRFKEILKNLSERN